MLTNIRLRALKVIQADSLTGRFSRGAFWSLVGVIGFQGASLLVTIVLARVLGKTGYGEFGMVYSTVIMLGEFAGAGLGLTTTKYISEFRKSDVQKASQIVALSLTVSAILGLIICSVFFFFPHLIASKLINAPELAPLFKIGALQVFFNTMIGIILGILAGLESFRSIGLNNVLRGVIYITVASIGVFYYGLRGAVIATTFTSGISMIIAIYFLILSLKRTDLWLEFKNSTKQLPILYNFALPAFLSNIVVVASIWIANIILVNLPSGFSELGQLNVVNQWKTLLSLLPAIIAQVLLPLLSSELSKKENKDSGSTLAVFQSITILIIFPIGVTFMFFSDIMLLIYGTEFENSGIVLIGAVWSILVASIGSVLGSFVQATGRMWIGFMTNIFYGLLLIAFTYFNASTYGANAVAYGSGLAYIIITIFSVIILAKHIPRPLIRQIIVALLLSLAILAVCLLLSREDRILFGLPAVVLAILAVYVFAIAPEVKEKLNLIVLVKKYKL